MNLRKLISKVTQKEGENNYTIKLDRGKNNNTFGRPGRKKKTIKYLKMVSFVSNVLFYKKSCLRYVFKRKQVQSPQRNKYCLKDYNINNNIVRNYLFVLIPDSMYSFLYTGLKVRARAPYTSFRFIVSLLLSRALLACRGVYINLLLVLLEVLSLFLRP